MFEKVVIQSSGNHLSGSVLRLLDFQIFSLFPLIHPGREIRCLKLFIPFPLFKFANARERFATNPHAASIDIGADELVFAIPPDRCPENVRTFRSFTANLYQLRDWLLEHKITTAAMESISNYWVNCYDILAEAGIGIYGAVIFNR